MTTPLFYFTNKTIEKIICSRTKEYEDIYIDTQENELLLIASSEDSKDTKVFCFNTIVPLGNFPDMSVEEARTIAAELRACICKGIFSLTKSDRSTELTFKQLFDKYIKEHCMHNNRWKEIIAKMNLHGEHFYKMQISTITSEDIQKTFNDVSNKGIYSANRFLMLLKAIFNKAIEWKLLVQNPAQSIKLHDEEVRVRCINTKEEMSRFLEAINAEPNKKMADFFLMLLFTGMRKGEVLSMRWQDINFENRAWYLRDHATKVYLVKDAITILERRQKDNHTGSIWVFPGNNSSTHLQEPKRAWKRICQLAGIDNLRIHDLRRTYGSLIRKAGANKEGIMQALGLKDIRSTKIYDSIESDQAEVKEFMEKAIQNLMLPEDTVTSQTKIADNIETQQRENAARQRKIEELNNK